MQTFPNVTGKLIAPHGVALDWHGDIHVGEVSFTDWPTTHPDEPIPANLRSLKKLRKVTLIMRCSSKTN